MFFPFRYMVIAFSALADGSRLYGIEALVYAYKRFDSVVGTGMPTRLFRGLKSPLSLFGNRWLAFVKSYLRWQASFMIPLMVRGSAAARYCLSRKNKGEHPLYGCPLVRKTDVRAVMVSSLLMITPPVTDERHTNCNTRSPRRFRFAKCRGLPCGNQSEPSGSRRQARCVGYLRSPA